MSLMHPSRQLFKVCWDSTSRLLLLAHKYDMPAVTGGYLTATGQLNVAHDRRAGVDDSLTIVLTIWHHAQLACRQSCSAAGFWANSMHCYDWLNSFDLPGPSPL